MKDGWNTELIHMANVDQIKEMSKSHPILRAAIEMTKRGVTWEQAMTAAALALSESVVRLERDLIYVLERTAVPIVLPSSLAK